MKTVIVVLVLLVSLAFAQRGPFKYRDCDQDSDTLKLEAKMKFLGFWVSVPGVENNLCKRGIECPIVKGDAIKGTMELDPPWYVPKMKTDVEIKIRGEKGMSVCLKSTVVIG